MDDFRSQLLVVNTAVIIDKTQQLHFLIKFGTICTTKNHKQNVGNMGSGVTIIVT